MNLYRIEDYNSLVIWKEWNRMLGIANMKPSRSVVVSLEEGFKNME